ncbi:MAG: molybdopterin biosynthesis protein [Rhodomicrobium sp.]|nr:MAG: molybdopterin biosynthesis protein [Rhodomicrobium sp.]
MSSLSGEEIERYKRHIILKQLGIQGQQKLKAAKVLVIGAGGLGSPVLLYLAAAGVGTIGIIDDDIVSLSNLQRQIIHDTDKVAFDKTTSAKERIAQINPHVEVIEHKTRINAGNAIEVISNYDIVADGSDNFSTRYLVNDACYFARKPLVFAAIGPFDGHLTTFRSAETKPDGTPNPNYRCIFPKAPPPGSVAPCSEVGVLGAIAGVMGTLQATEVIKEITGIGTGMVGRLLLYNALETEFQTVKINWDKTNPLNGEAPTLKDLSHHMSEAES